MEERKRFYLAGVTIIVGILSLLAASAMLWRAGIAIAIAVTIVVFAAFALRNMAKSTRKGLPLEDEFSKRAKTSAAAFAFYASLYLWLTLMYFEDYLPESRLPALAILGSAIIFGLRYLYLVKRGRVN